MTTSNHHRGGATGIPPGGVYPTSGTDADSDDGTETEASVYLTPELNERHVVLDRRRLYKQHRLVESQDRRGFSKNSSRSISTDDDECYYSSTEAAPLNRLESRLYMLAMAPAACDAREDFSSGVPCRRRQVGEDTIHEICTEDLGNTRPRHGGVGTVCRGLQKQHSAETVDYQIHVSRPAYTIPHLREDLCFQPEPEQGFFSSAKNYVKSCCHCSPGSLWALLLLRVPLLAWLPRYSFRRDCVSDLIAGCTVAVMHLPQGMAYAMLAEVPPIYGLYTAFFPVFAYAIFGTSRHISMGTFAVACLMTGKVVGELAAHSGGGAEEQTFTTEATVQLLGLVNNTTIHMATNLSGGVTENLIQNHSKDGSVFEESVSLSSSDYFLLVENSTESVTEYTTGVFGTTIGTADAVTAEGEFTPIQVAVAVSLFVGIWHMVFGLLQLGQVCVFLSDMLISGFTTGAACHVLSSQVKHILGIDVQRYSGPFRLIYTYNDIIKMLPTVNIMAIILSAICITVLVLNNEILKPRLKKRTNFPMPIELIVVIFGTVVAYFGQLEQTHDLTVVGHIPTGLPRPEVPKSELFIPVLMDSLVLAIVIYAISFSMAKIFSKKHGYPVDATQELYAGGLSNIFGSMFFCVPSAASLSRSLIQESVGGKTQVTSFFSCGLILIILLIVGPIFESLPTCVLASIVVVALKGMFMQVYDLQKMLKQSKVDSLLWVITFLVTVLVDIDYGLASGVLFSLLLLLKRNNSPIVKRFGWVPNTDIYVDIDTYQSAVALPGVRICCVFGALHFATCDTFKAELTKATGLDIALIIAAKMKKDKKSKSSPTTARDKKPASLQPPEAAASTAKTDALNKSEKVAVTDASNQNLTRKVMKDAFVNVMKGKSSYAGNRDDLIQTGTLGIHNEAFLSDDLYEKYTPPILILFEFLNPSDSPPKPANGTVIVMPEVTMVVLCLSGVGWIDVAAAKQLASLFSDYSAAGITMSLAGVNDSIMRVLRISGAFASMPENRFFHTIHDAVTFLMPDLVPQTVRWNTKAAGSGRSSEGCYPTTHDARPAVVPPSSKRTEVTFGSCGDRPAGELPPTATLHADTSHNPVPSIMSPTTQTSDGTDTGIRKRENVNEVDETIRSSAK